MSLDMLLQVLRTLEGLATKVTLVWLQRHMYSNVRSDVIPLDRSSVASSPLASQVQVVGALATDMALTDVFLLSHGVVSTVQPHHAKANLLT